MTPGRATRSPSYGPDVVGRVFLVVAALVAVGCLGLVLLPEDAAAPPGSRPDAVTVTAAGDIGECGGGAPQTAPLVAGERFLALGDLAYPQGSARDFRHCYAPSYGALRDRTYPVPGNHDRMSDGPYFRFFRGRAGTSARPWYSRDIGAWHVVFLDSNCPDAGGCAAGSPQYRWLVRDLAAHPRRCLAAVWHHPRFSSSEYGDDSSVAPFYRAVAAAGGDIVLNGHAHFYERFPRLDAAGNPTPTGMREFIVGTGGADLYPFVAERPASEVRWNEGFGVLRLELAPDGYTWRFLAADGEKVIDSGADSCG